MLWWRAIFRVGKAARTWPVCQRRRIGKATDSPPPKGPLAGSLWFPQPPRNFNGQRWLRISLRTVHLISMVFLVGGVALGHSVTDPPVSLWGTVLSGVLFVGVDLAQSLVWLFQLKGLAVVVRALLLVGAAMAPRSALAMLELTIIIGGISSHMPGKYRYDSIWHGRVIKE